MRQGNIKYLFPGNNTPQGFISHYKDGLKGLEQVYILKGGPGTGKSTLMRKIGGSMLERGYDVEFWQCSSDNDSIDGVIIPALSLGVIDGMPPHNMDPRYPGAVEEIVDLGSHWNRAMLKSSKKDIIALTDEIGSCYAAGYEKLAEAGDLLKDQYDNELINSASVDQMTTDLSGEIFCGGAASRHLFSSAITPRGIVDFSEKLSRTVRRRWLLQGSPGCGKEIIIRRLLQEATGKGHYCEIYHPAMRPDDIQLLLIPDLEAAILDIGENMPDTLQETDRLVDCRQIGESLSPADPDELNALINSAIDNFARAKDIHDKLELHYSRAMDFDAVDAVGSSLFNRILAIAAEKEE